MIVDEIHCMLKDYFDVLQNQDMATFDRVFHPDCVLYSAQDGALVVRPYKEYRAVVQGRKSPQEGGFPRHDEILSVDIMAPEAAMVKVRLRLFDNIMVDYLSLLKINGQWMIMAKIYHRQAPAA